MDKKFLCVLVCLISVGLVGLEASAEIAPETTTTEVAQSEFHRDDFWVSVGLGVGSLGCETCSARLNGGSGGLAVGGTINQQLLVGGGTLGYSGTEGQLTVRVMTLVGLARYYLQEDGGFYLTGGLGFGMYSLSSSYGGSVSENGIALFAGAGIDIPMGESLNITPFFNGVGLSLSNRGTWDFGQLGVALTWH